MGTLSRMQHRRALLVVGADGCKGGGWVLAVIDGEGQLTWEYADDTAALLAATDGLEADAVALDVPIGLPGLGERRECDDLARRRLGLRRSSVFAAPPREVLACATYAQARPVAPSLSAQAFGLVPRIREVDALLRSRGAAVHGSLVECHPEVAFHAMAAGRVTLGTKKSAAGALQRIGLLEEAMDDSLPVDVPPRAALDDALDAAASALVALRWASGVADVLGDERDALGLPMRIVV
jgi:predicted RNase H-like nuclease